MTVAATRHWTLPDTHNIRDLGGYARTTGGMTQWNRVLRGEALHHLNAQSVDDLIDRGLALVIDLRGPHETSTTAHPFIDHPRIDYRNIALFDALSPIALSETPFDMAQRYRDALDRCGARMTEVLRTVINAPDGIVLIHCTAGKDRTGIVAALLLAAAGVAPDEVARDYALTALAEGMIRHLRERALANGAPAEHIDRVLASDASTMLSMLDHLDSEHGGIHAYLDKIGLTPDEVQTLVVRLCN
jgi:protein-tyrosine phosphatase